MFKKFAKMTVIVATGVMMASTASAASTTNNGTNPNGKPFLEIDRKFDYVLNEITSLQDLVTSLVGRVTTVEDKQAALTDAVANLEVASADLQLQIATLENNIEAIDQEILYLQLDNADLREDIVLLGDADGEMQALIRENDAKIMTLNLAVTEMGASLQDSIDNNTALIAAMQSQIAALQVEMDMKQNVIDGFCPNGAAIRQIYADGSVACEADDIGSGGAEDLYAYWTYKVEAIQPGQGAVISATCDPGYMPMSTGFYANEMTAYSVLTIPTSRASAGKYGSVSIVNNSPIKRNGYLYLTCLRIKN